MISSKAKSWFPIIIIGIVVISMASTFHLRSWWPILLGVSIIFFIIPAWWTVLLASVAFTFALKTGWPLLIGLLFAITSKPKRWWPIPAGIAFGLTELLSFTLSEKPIGITRGYTSMGSIIEYLFAPDHAEKMAYWELYDPLIGWTTAVIVGVVLGSMISARSSGEFKIRYVPDIWKLSKGPSVFKRWVWAFLAGILMGFAARIAGGCVSGLMISGVIQLAPSGFIFMFSLWVGGLATTLLFYRFRSISIKRE